MLNFKKHNEKIVCGLLFKYSSIFLFSLIVVTYSLYKSYSSLLMFLPMKYPFATKELAEEAFKNYVTVNEITFE